MASSEKMRVLIADRIAEEGVEALKTRFDVDVKPGMGRDQLIATIGDYDGLVVRSESRVTAEVIAAGKRLQVVGRAGVGVDNIDIEAATRHGVVVVNAPAGNTISAAEHTIALMLALSRNIPQANASLKSGQWRRQEFMGIEVRNKSLGIIGLGNVGSEVARRAKGMEMRIIGHDPFVSVEYARTLGVELVSIEELLKEADFITVHTPMSAATRGLIGARELATVKPSVRIINCARGGIIDEDALLRAVEEGKVAGAAVDVFSEEPATHNVLFGSDKIIVTPHLAASTAEAQTTVAVDVAAQVIAVLEGQPVRYAVNAPLILPETLAVVTPFMGVARQVGQLLAQLAEGQVSAITIKYEGEIANYDSAALKAAILGGLLESVSEERVNIVNAHLIAQGRGIKVTEQKDPECQNYGNLITTEVTTSTAVSTVAGTVMREQPHIVRMDDYWIDVVPCGAYFLFSDHRDRPGLIGTVGMILGDADINISSMQVSRLEPRGRALMVLGLDESIGEEQRRKLLDIPDVYTIKVVRL